MTSFRLPELVLTLKYALIGSASFSTPVITSCKVASPYGIRVVFSTLGIDFAELNVTASFTGFEEMSVSLLPDTVALTPPVVLKLKSERILLLSVSFKVYFPSEYFIS